MARTYRCAIDSHKKESQTDNTYVIVFNCHDLKTVHSSGSKVNYWDKTDHFEVKWSYTTGQKDSKGKVLSFPGEESTVKFKGAKVKHIYKFSIPTNAVNITFNVKPIAKEHDVKNGKKTEKKKYYSGSWLSKALTIKNIYNKVRLATPPVPSLSYDDSDKSITASIIGYKSDTTSKGEATHIEFNLIKMPGTNAGTFKVKLVKRDASLKFTPKFDAHITDGSSSKHILVKGAAYKIRARAIGDKETDSLYSEYSSEFSIGTAAPTEALKLSYYDQSTIKVRIPEVKGAVSYELSYTTKREFFDVGDMSVVDGVTESIKYISNIATGVEYFFRYRTVDKYGMRSDYSKISSIIIGIPPSAPTTWSLTDSMVTGESMKLYWVHNARDGSSQESAILKFTCRVIDTKEYDEETDKWNITYRDVPLTSISVKNAKDELLKDENLWLELVTNSVGQLMYRTKYDSTLTSITVPSDLKLLSQGSFDLLWTVKTRGAYPHYSPVSVQRAIHISEAPKLSISLYDGHKDRIINEDNSATSFPLSVVQNLMPATAIPLGYKMIIESLDSYTTLDPDGTEHLINQNDIIFERIYDTGNSKEVFELYPYDVDFEPGCSYRLTLYVTVSSGLKAESSIEFSVEWDDEAFTPEIEAEFDETNYTSMILVSCRDTLEYTDEYLPEDTPEDEVPEISEDEYIEAPLSENVILSVYRRELDGSFVLIADNIPNDNSTWVPDPHPTLDYMRYRVVATSTVTGAINYADYTSDRIGIPSAIITWNEDITMISSSNTDVDDENNNILPIRQSWAGNMLKLDYDIDIEDSYDMDTEMLKYIGRQHPVSYYGTQLGHTSNWKASVLKDDVETLNMLRRLAVFTGDCYVREPNGSGYYANVKPSFALNHCEQIVPISLSITRVDK